MKKLLALFVVVLGFSAVSFGQSSATASASASATILGPLTLTHTDNLVFGTLVPTAAAGTVVLTPGGTATGTGVTVTAIVTPTAAKYTAGGTANRTYAITLPANDVVTIVSGGNNMKVQDFTCSIASGDLGAGASQDFTVGATLEVGASQAAGSYTGTYNVKIDYN